MRQASHTPSDCHRIIGSERGASWRVDDTIVFALPGSRGAGSRGWRHAGAADLTLGTFGFCSSHSGFMASM